jgi:hypothetical protein
MNEQFIEYWRQVAEFDYPALQAELATSEAARERAEKVVSGIRALSGESDLGEFSKGVGLVMSRYLEEGKG